MTALRLVKGEPLASAPSVRRHGNFDLVIDGTNLTARLPPVDEAAVLIDLTHALGDLCCGRAERATIRCHVPNGAWEIGVERAGGQALVSVYCASSRPEVAVYERPVSLAALVSTVRAMLSGHAPALAERSGEIGLCLSQLNAIEVIPTERPRDRFSLSVAPETDSVLRFSADFAMRTSSFATERERSAVERSDLFGLLVRGGVEIAISERVRSFSDVFVFLFAEQLLSFASGAFEAWEHHRTFFRRADLSGVPLGVRFVPEPVSEGSEIGAEPGTWLSVGPLRGEGRTFRLPEASTLAEAAVAFGRSLSRGLLRRDPSQKQNLRLSAFRRAVRDLDERLREVSCDDIKVNPTPELYRTFGTAQPSSSSAREASKLRFGQAWNAAFPGIDLRASFLCGDRLIIGGSRETSCIDKRTGELFWRRPTEPAVSVVTPEGLARLFPDGSIALHEFGTGEVVTATRVSPRVGGVVTGAVVSAPGLPKLLVVSEGRRRLSAVDLCSGEVRWRHTSLGGSVFRLRRAGKLLLVAAGDATLTALDISLGEIVWRTRDRLRFSSHLGLDHDALFAVAGNVGSQRPGKFRLHHLDPYAGTTRWVRDLPDVTPVGSPLVTHREVVLVTRDRRGLGLLSIGRSTGETLWSCEPGLFPTASAWLTVDDTVVLSSDRGDLCCFSAGDGATKWRHRFGRGMEGDQPRRLEPILRGGALFVPQQQVHVVRPRDGAILGVVPTDLIPDMLRVDEHCDVFIAEESGHVAAFRAGAKLSVVQE